MTTLFRTLLLALAFACGSAWATPTYRVVVDTGAAAGQWGWLDFLILGQAGASPVRATLGGFAGIDGDGTAPLLAGDAASTGTGAATGAVLGNGTGWNEFAVWTRFGGRIGFTVLLDIDPAAGPGSTLEVALLDAHGQYAGGAGDVLAFALLPDAAPVVAHTDAVTLPEAPAPVLVGTGLALLGLARRRAAARRALAEAARRLLGWQRAAHPARVPSLTVPTRER